MDAGEKRAGKERISKAHSAPPLPCNRSDGCSDGILQLARHRKSHGASLSCPCPPVCRHAPFSLAGTETGTCIPAHSLAPISRRLGTHPIYRTTVPFRFSVGHTEENQTALGFLCRSDFMRSPGDAVPSVPGPAAVAGPDPLLPQYPLGIVPGDLAVAALPGSDHRPVHTHLDFRHAAFIRMAVARQVARTRSGSGDTLSPSLLPGRPI